MKITKTTKNKGVYEKRIIAFVDILGFSTMIEDSRADTTLRRKIKQAMTIVRDTHNKDLSDDIRKVTTFSDSAVISYVADEHSSLFYLLIDIIHLQLRLGALGIMIRGGIVYGDCYHDGDIVFGPAMNEAYWLESKIAKWPRVVITKDTLDKAIDESVDHGTYTYDCEVEEIGGCIQKDIYTDDSDYAGEMYFVDYLRQSQELIDYGDEYLEWLRAFREAIISGLNRYSPKNGKQALSKADAKKIFGKYRHTLKYWNSVVGDDNAAMPVPQLEKEDQIAFRKMYKELVISKRYPYI